MLIVTSDIRLSPKSFAAFSVVGSPGMRFLARETSRAFVPLPVSSRSVFAYIVYIFLPPSSAFEARLVGKANLI